MTRIILIKLTKEFKRFIAISILLAIIMFAGMLLISLYERETEKIQPFKEILDEKGHVFYSQDSIIVDNEEDRKQFEKNLIKVKDYCYVPTAMCSSGINNNSGWMNVICYPDNMNAYIPMLSEGVWYSEVNQDNCIPVVVSPNVPNAEINKKIKLYFSGKAVEVYVTGILAEGASFYNVLKGKINSSIFDLYSSWGPKSDVDDRIVLMSMDNDNEILKNNLASYGTVFVTYEKTITQDEFNFNSETLNKKGIFVQSFDEIKKRSDKVVFNNVIDVFTVAISASLFAFLAILCIMILETKNNMKDDSILYLNGLSKKNIIMVGAVVDLFTGVTSFLITVFLSGLAKRKLKLIVFDIGIKQILAGLIVVMFAMITAIIVRLVLFRKNSVVYVLNDTKV